MTRQSEKSGPDPSLRYPWYVVFILILVFITAFLDRQILSLLVNPIRAEIGITDFQIGLLQGLAFALFYSICILPAGWMVDRYNRRNLLVAGVFIWSLMTVACGMADNFTELFLARMGVGIGEAVLHPVAYSLICDYFPRKKWPAAIGVYSVGGGIGAGLAYVFGAAAATVTVKMGAGVDWPVVGHVAPWQMPFFVVGVPGLLVAGLCLTIAEPIRGAHEAVAQVAVRLSRFFRERWRLSICYIFGIGLLNAISYANFAWIPTYFERIHGWHTTRTAVILGIILLTFGTAGILAGGFGAAHLTRRYRDATLRLAMAISLLLAPLCVLAALVPNPWVALALYVPVFFFMTSFVSLGPTTIQLVTPAPMRGRVTAFALLGTNILAISLGPASVASVTDFVFRDDAMIHASLAISGGGLAVLSAIFLWLGLGPYRRALDASPPAT